MEFRIISLPAFRAASSGADPRMDFSPEGALGKFNKYFSAITPSPRDSFMPRDFLYYDEKRGGMVWLWALADGMDDGGFETVNFDGGYYLTYAYRDGDEAEGARLHKEALAYIHASSAIELDTRANRFAMGHIITPAPIARKQGFSQMETFLPIRIR